MGYIYDRKSMNFDSDQYHYTDLSGIDQQQIAYDVRDYLNELADDFSKFVFDEDKQIYSARDIKIVFNGKTESFMYVRVGFADGKLTFCDLVLSHEKAKEGDAYGTVFYAFDFQDYGTTVIG